MDQIISLLTSLFNLNKVASVTLPGLVMAAVVAGIFWPPHPVDTVAITLPEFSAPHLKSPQTPTSALSPARGNANKKNWITLLLGPKNDPRLPACTMHRLDMRLFDPPFDSNNDEWKKQWNGTIELLVKLELFRERNEEETPEEARTRTINAILEMAQGKETQLHPWDARVPKQFVLEKAKDLLTQCEEIETSWKDQEEADNQQLTTDITNLDKQRSDLQDAYINSLKSNNRILSENFRAKLEGILELANQWRERYRVNLASINERQRRLDEIKREQDSITARLGEPGRLRPLVGFDLYMQALINHVVSWILLSIALSLVLNAFDRAIFGNIFELLLPGW